MKYYALKKRYIGIGKSKKGVVAYMSESRTINSTFGLRSLGKN
jgi:hypothetical protein